MTSVEIPVRRPTQTVLLVIAVVLVSGALIRLVGLNWGLPYLQHPDEVTSLSVTQTMVRNGDPNPHFYHWPSLPFYVQSVPYAAFVASSTVTGHLDGTDDVALPDVQTVGTGFVGNPNVLRIGRTVTIILGLGIVAMGALLVWYLTRRTWVTAVAALFLALEPMLVKNSRWMTPDIFVAFFTFAAVAMAIAIYRRDRQWQYALAGVFVGCAASSKYNGALVASAIVVAHLLRYRKRFFVEPGIYIAGAASVAAFLLTTPGILFATSEAWAGITFDLDHYSTGHPGAEGALAEYYARTIWRSIGPVLLFIPFAFSIRKLRMELIVLLVYPMTHVALLLGYVVRFERNLLPAVGPLLVVSAIGVWGFAEFLSERRLKTNVVFAVTAIAGALAVAIPLSTLIDDTRRYSGDHRGEARTWIVDNIPGEAAIAQDVYSPYLDEARYKNVVSGLLLHSDRVLDPRFDYVILTERGSGRFINDPDRYSEEVERLELLREEFCTVAEFTGYEPSIVLARCPGE